MFKGMIKNPYGINYGLSEKDACCVFSARAGFKTTGHGTGSIKYLQAPPF
jgi:hypothetical protein